MLDNAEPILSVIVPTKNRYYYLSYLIDYFITIDSPSIELIIQDNSDDIQNQICFLNKLKDIDDKRIVYEFDREPISVIENSDRAVSRARGKFISFIGDDDIFSKYILQLVFEMELQNVDVVFPINAMYSWPDIQARMYGNRLSGKFLQTAKSGRLKFVNCYSELSRALKLGGTDILNLPRLYHGIVKKELLSRIYEITGTYFPGPSPDIANAIALCFFSKKYILLDVPLIVSGHSNISTGGQGAAGKHYGELSEIAHLPKSTTKEWNKEIPFYWSGTTIYAESVLQALLKLNKNFEISRFNYNYLFAVCLVFDKQYKERILKTIEDCLVRSSDKNISKVKIYSFYYLVWFRRIKFHIANNLGYLIPMNKKDNIQEFSNIYDVAIANDLCIKKLLDKQEVFIRNY